MTKEKVLKIFRFLEIVEIVLFLRYNDTYQIVYHLEVLPC